MKLQHLKKLFLNLISLPFLSRIWGQITRLEHPGILVQAAIKLFASHYEIDMSRYEGVLESYDSLCQFFTRRLDFSKVSIPGNDSEFLSPCDGTVSVCELTESDTATQVKGRTYTISGLIRKELNFGDGYRLITIYLSPSNYHRFHVPVESDARAYLHTGWRLFPVNRLAVNSIDELFVRNERVVVKFQHRDFEYFYTAVGASFVGSIKMNFAEELAAESWQSVDCSYRQNEELGMFEMGSTIVLVVPESAVGKVLVSAGEKVSVGQPLFVLKEKHDDQAG